VTAKASSALVLPWTATSEGLIPMIGGLLQRAHCGTDRVLIHFGKDGSNGAAGRSAENSSLEFIAGEISTA
jgi:hypothetical protein